MPRWIACLLALMLTGCWTSDRPEMPLGELVQPAGLPGRYWTVSLEGTGSEPGLVEFRPGADGGMVSDDAGKSGSETFRLVHTSVSGVYLKVADYDERSAVYGLLEHRDLGAWQDYSIEEVSQDAFTGPSLAWMQNIAGRHGLRLDVSDPDETRIAGKIHGLAIPSLFADPAFLATLRVVPVQLYLPGPSAPQEREELFPRGEPSLPLQLDQADLPGADWIAPAGLEGEYVQGQSNTRSFRPDSMRFVRLPDGRFEIRAPDSQGKPRILGLLPLKGLENDYLAVSFEHWSHDGKESDYLTLSILARTETGWSIAYIAVRGTETLAGRQDLLSQPMGEAAQRQGASLERFKLRGGLTAKSLLALLRDGQFTTGLEVDRQGATQFAATDLGQTQHPTAK